MKKLMMLVCVLGFASIAYAQMGSPVWDARIMSEGFSSTKTKATVKKTDVAIEKENEKAAKAAAEKAAAEKEAKVANRLEILATLRDVKGKAVTGKDIKNRYDYMIAQIEGINGSDDSAQSALYAVEDFASYVLSTTREEYLPFVKDILSSATCKVRGQRVSLKAAVEEVNDAALQAGNGIPSAGVNDKAKAFYRSL